MLGVANELFELLISQLGILFIDPSDTWWDLLANTLGALSLGTICIVWNSQQSQKEKT